MFARAFHQVLVCLAVCLPCTGAWLHAQIGPMAEEKALIITTPQPPIEPNRLANSGPFTASYTVRNQSTSTVVSISLECLVNGPLTCIGATPSSRASLAPGASFGVTVSYSTGTTGIGNVWLQATWGDAVIDSDKTSRAVTVVTAPAITLVAPVLTSGSRAVVRTRQPLVRALLQSGGSPIDTARTSLSWRGEVVTALSRHNRAILEWEVDSTRWLGIGDSAQASVTACALDNHCSTVTRWVVLENDQKPVLGFAGMPLETSGSGFGAPFGPGLSVSGAELETGFGIPGYISMGAARSAGLVYSTRQSYPRALVPVDLELPWPAGTPTQVKLVLTDGVTRLDSLVLSSPSCATGGVKRCRAVLQGDFSATSFPSPVRKWLTVEAWVTSGAVTKMGTDSVEVVLVDRRTTRYGSGWWPAGVAQLVAAGSDRLLIGPTGSAAIYRGNGDSVYVSPPGSFVSLVKTASGWELRPRGSLAKTVFDAQGRLQKSVDQNGNRDSVAYSGTSDQVTSFTDPVGKSITLSYNGSGKLTTLTDPGGRQSVVTINTSSNQLTGDSLASPTTRGNRTTFAYQAYPGTGTTVLTKRVGVILDTTIVTYDSTFKRRPTQTRLPQVKNELGATVNPVIAYIAYERRGYGGFVSLDSVYVEMKDPRNNWTRSLLNRWGQARKTWDALGLIGRSQYTAEGLVLWSEGKNGDSSRVYNTYDSALRLARSFIIRAVGDTLRTDSLVYDANHRVVKRIDARGKADSLRYDATGNLIEAKDPAGFVARTWFRSDGLADSSRAPGQTKSSRFTYDAIWKNLSQVADESDSLALKRSFDAFGRDTTADGKVAIQTSGSSTGWQWRRTRTYFNVANQVDSTIRFISTNTSCNSSCTPVWPLLSDTNQTRRVAHRFDRAGRDSLRLNDRGKATLYLYDRLSRVVSRRPWTDSTAVKDSMLYDVAGNLKQTITRRGHSITTNYDSRNRDTLTVVPGLGTLRKAFGGPLDQRTRQWIASPVDSIGGVNAEVRWGYDQRGRLRGDSSYTGAAARATTYGYDTYERPTSMTDPLGVWATRYETDRGAADSLITPFADTLIYAFDGQGRPSGPTLRSSGPLQQNLLSWSVTSQYSGMTRLVSGGTPYVVASYDRQGSSETPGPALGPTWTERHGPAAATDSVTDSVRYDGWERLKSYTAKLNGGVIETQESYTYDRLENVRTTAGAEIYDLVTQRLIQRTDGTHVWRYSYDRAGNLVQARDSIPAVSVTVWDYGSDALNRLVSVRRAGTLIARYAYDVLGRRIAKRVYSSASGGTIAYTRFVYHGQQVGFETDSVGNLGLQYTWGLGTDELVAVHEPGGAHYYAVTDKLGSVRALVARDGTWRQSWRNGPWGKAGTSSPPHGGAYPLRYRWTGREWDAESGLYYFRARYYDPGQRRFIQEDPIGYAGGTNVYAYVAGRPLESTDPTGMQVSLESQLHAHAMSRMNRWPTPGVSSMLEAICGSPGVTCVTTGWDGSIDGGFWDPNSHRSQGLCAAGRSAGSSCDQFADYVDRVAAKSKTNDEFVRTIGKDLAGFPDGWATPHYGDPASFTNSWKDDGFREDLIDNDRHAWRHFAALLVVGYQHGFTAGAWGALGWEVQGLFTGGGSWADVRLGGMGADIGSLLRRGAVSRGDIGGWIRGKR